MRRYFSCVSVNLPITADVRGGSGMVTVRPGFTGGDGKNYRYRWGFAY